MALLRLRIYSAETMRKICNVISTDYYPRLGFRVLSKDRELIKQVYDKKVFPWLHRIQNKDMFEVDKATLNLFSIIINFKSDHFIVINEVKSLVKEIEQEFETNNTQIDLLIN